MSHASLPYLLRAGLVKSSAAEVIAILELFTAKHDTFMKKWKDKVRIVARGDT